jgi:tRNA/rRNA methyltransferase
VDTERLRIVLVRPEEAGNVGAAARLCKNFGLSRLVLVAPRLSRPQEAARWAHGAEDVLDGADWVDTLEEAVGPCAVAWATSRRGGKTRGSVLEPRAAAERLRAAVAAGQDAAWVFGPESRGLTTAEMALCSGRVRIPTSPRQPSLNLAQAVAICVYETMATPSEVPPRGREATLEERAALWRHLAEALLAVGYLEPRTATSRMVAVRALLERGVLSPQDVKLLRGMARQILWAAGRKP